MTTDGTIATHADPAWRERANYIIRVDLADHGMPGRFEQLWTRTEDEGRTFELCCIPFFTYGFALGDILSWDSASETASLVRRSGRRCIRMAFNEEATASARHEELHGLLAGCDVLTEFCGGGGLGAVDLPDEEHAAAVIEALSPWVVDGAIVWEWAEE